MKEMYQKLALEVKAILRHLERGESFEEIKKRMEKIDFFLQKLDVPHLEKLQAKLKQKLTQFFETTDPKLKEEVLELLIHFEQETLEI